MITTIYTDTKRTLEMDEHGRLSVKNPTRTSISADLSDEHTHLTDTLPPGTALVLRARGDEPTGWYAVISHGHPRAVLPPETRQAMRLAIATAQAERRIAHDDPANVARRAVEAFFTTAERLQDDPGRYFPARIAAERALTAWQERYPEAATRERREHLLADADDLERKASGALVYDADGWLSAADQQARHDEWMAEAAKKRAEAAAI